MISRFGTSTFKWLAEDNVDLKSSGKRYALQLELRNLRNYAIADSHSRIFNIPNIKCGYVRRNDL
jgi:hypothetical protein